MERRADLSSLRRNRTIHQTAKQAFPLLARREMSQAVYRDHEHGHAQPKKVLATLDHRSVHGAHRTGGISAMQISKELEVQFKTAWFMLHRISTACDEGMFKLTAVVEVDETYVDGKERNKHQSRKLEGGRGTVGKAPVVEARQRDGKVSAQSVKHVDRRTMTEFVESRAEPGTIVYTDEAAVFGSLSTLFNRFRHEPVNHSSGEFVRGNVNTNSIESVWAVFKRSFIGTWHNVSNKHLFRHVNEATLKLNEGNCEVEPIDRMIALASRIGNKQLRLQELEA